jgi:hypothetical protein
LKNNATNSFRFQNSAKKYKRNRKTTKLRQKVQKIAKTFSNFEITPKIQQQTLSDFKTPQESTKNYKNNFKFQNNAKNSKIIQQTF